MNKTRWIRIISGALLASLALSSSAYAKQSPRKPDVSNKTLRQHDQPLLNSGRHRMQLSERKLAAKRLKGLHEQAKAQHMQDEINRHGKHLRGN